MIISMDSGKSFDQLQHFMIKKTKNTLNKLTIEGYYQNITKAIVEDSTGNIMLKDERLKAFPQSSEQDKDAHSPMLLILVLEVLARVIRQEKEMKSIKTQQQQKRTWFKNGQRT